MAKRVVILAVKMSNCGIQAVEKRILAAEPVDEGTAKLWSH